MAGLSRVGFLGVGASEGTLLFGGEALRAPSASCEAGCRLQCGGHTMVEAQKLRASGRPNPSPPTPQPSVSMGLSLFCFVYSFVCLFFLNILY